MELHTGMILFQMKNEHAKWCLTTLGGTTGILLANTCEDNSRYLVGTSYWCLTTQDNMTINDIGYIGQHDYQ